MGEYECHKVNFFKYEPTSIQSLAYEPSIQKVAVGRSNGSLEVWNIENNNWFQEIIFPKYGNHTIESVVWFQGRIFSAGLDGNIFEHNIECINAKKIESSNCGPIWSMCTNEKSALMIGTEDGSIVKFNLQKNIPIVFDSFLTRQNTRILCLSWIKDSNFIVSGGQEIIILNFITSEILTKISISKGIFIWSISASSDWTIISGDSSGQTSFWNGKLGTLLQSFICHKSDVLSVIMESDTKAFSSSADATVIAYDFIDGKWHQNNPHLKKNYHSHDIKAMCNINKNILTGGIDCNLVVHMLNEKSVKIYVDVPHYNVIHFSEKSQVLLLQYKTKLELWMIGKQNSESEKLLELNSRHSELIVCSALSNSGKLLAFSDSRRLSLFSIELCDNGFKLLKLHLNKSIDACWRVSFSLNDSIIVCCQSKGNISIIDASNNYEVTKLFVEKTIHILSMDFTGKYFCFCDIQSNISIYDVKNKLISHALPHYSSKVTAINFHKEDLLLIVAYSDYSIYEYNMGKKSFRNCNIKIKSLLTNKETVTNIQYFKGNNIFFHTQTIMYFINDDNVKQCQNFKYILYAQLFDNDKRILIVEVTDEQLQRHLPPAIIQKTFGT